MTTDSIDTFLADEEDHEHPEDRLQRDRWGRPLINLPGPRKGRTGYRRASSFGAPLESDYSLILWMKRQVARGVSHRDDLQIAVTRAEIGLDDPEPAVAKAAKAELDKLAEAAMVEVGSDAKATIGTAIHHICERIDRGMPPGHVPTAYRPDIAAYLDLTTPLFRMVSIERFVVHDELRVAGTLDRAAELLVPVLAPDGTLIPAGEVLLGDVKTSQNMDFAGSKFAVQCFVYAAGIPYDTRTGQREEWGHAAPRTDWGLIIHVPSGQGRAVLYWVDLAEAGIAAQDALRVHEWRSTRGKNLITRAQDIHPRPDFMALAAAASSLDELDALYVDATAAGAWNDIVRAAFSRRKSQLTT